LAVLLLSLAIIWTVLAVIVGIAANARGNSGFVWTSLALLTSPLIAGFVLMALARKRLESPGYFLPWLDEILSQMKPSAESNLPALSLGAQPEFAANSHSADFKRADRLKIELLKAIGDLMRAAEICDHLKGELAALRSPHDTTAASPPTAGRVHRRNRYKVSACPSVPQSQKLSGPGDGKRRPAAIGSNRRFVSRQAHPDSGVA
jgi:hypothetical protein